MNETWRIQTRSDENGRFQKKDGLQSSEDKEKKTLAKGDGLLFAKVYFVDFPGVRITTRRFESVDLSLAHGMKNAMT